MSAELPTRKEVTDLARSALGLIVGRENPKFKWGFDEYGGLESAYSIYETMGQLVRIGTLQDPQGTSEWPDMHIVTTEDVESKVKSQTRYQFWSDGLWKWRYYKILTIDDEAIVSDDRSRQIAFTAGNIALRRLEGVPMPRSERKLLKQAATLSFDRQRYAGLKELIASCGSHNIVEIN